MTRAVLRRRDRRPRVAGAAHAGAGRNDRRLDGGQLILSRHQGLRERLAEAPHLVGHARCLGVRHARRQVPPADPVQRRGPESRVRRQRERLLLPERAERVVQRLQELAGQSVAIHRAHPLHEKSRPVPDALDDGHAVLHVRRRGVHARARRRRPSKVPIQIAEEGRSTRDRIVPVNGGFTEATLSPNGKEFAYVFRGEIFVSSVDGSIAKRVTNTPWQERSVRLQPGRPVAGLRRGAGQQLEHLHRVARLARRSRTSSPRPS